MTNLFSGVPLYVLLPMLCVGFWMGMLILGLLMKTTVIVGIAACNASEIFIHSGSAWLGNAIVRGFARLVLFVLEGWKRKPKQDESPEDDFGFACRVMGLRSDCSRTEMETKYRKLVIAIHPDKAGTDWLAAQVNRARDIIVKEKGWKQ